MVSQVSQAAEMQRTQGSTLCARQLLGNILNPLNIRLPHLSGLPWDSSAAARLDSSSARRGCRGG